MLNFVAACMYAFQIIAPICIFRFFFDLVLFVIVVKMLNLDVAQKLDLKD